MKELLYMRMTRLLAVAGVMAGLLAGSSVLAKDQVSVTTITQTLRHSTTMEVPATAAKLVKESPLQTREATVRAVVKAAVEMNSSLAPMIVGAVARVAPEHAAVAAATAAVLQPRQSASIARAAAAAAPLQAGRITLAVCREVPSNYLSIASQVNQAVPSASREIAISVATAVPTTKASVDGSLAIYGGSPASAVILLTGPGSTGGAPGLTPGGSGSGVLPRGPSQGPPFKPLTDLSTTTAIDPVTQATVVPIGERNYAAP